VNDDHLSLLVWQLGCACLGLLGDLVTRVCDRRRVGDSPIQHIEDSGGAAFCGEAGNFIFTHGMIKTHTGTEF